MAALSDAAAQRVRDIMSNAEKPVVGLRVGVKNGGCAGQEYVFEYAEAKGPIDEVVEDKGVTILIEPKAVLFLGKCGGLKKTKLGDFVLPIAAIRGEGTSNDYLPPEVPALPAFALQKAISTTIRDFSRDYWTGTVYTTNRRVWEHDETFKKYLKKIRALCIDMETATIFVTGFHNEIATGALLLVSDQPMTPEGIKTAASDQQVDETYVTDHLKIGIASLKQLINRGLTVKHLKF